MTRYFKKIEGYKVVVKCRNCGKRVVSKTETMYCDDCLRKLREWRDKE